MTPEPAEPAEPEPAVPPEPAEPAEPAEHAAAAAAAAPAEPAVPPEPAEPAQPTSAPEALPPRPWQPPRRPERAPRPALTRDAIVDAALSIVAELGADQLTMRRVAERLGVAAASLYGHVSNKEELVQLLMDRVFSEIPAPDPTKDWKLAARGWLSDSRKVLRRHPGVAGLTLGRIPVGANSFANMDALLGMALRAGIPPKIVAFSGDLFGLYLGAFVHEEDMTAQAGAQAADDMVTMFRDWLKSLPADRFPNMVKLADLLTEGDSDERFELGLDVLLRGIESYIPAGKRPATG